MEGAEERRREKSRQLRYKKPIVRDINIEKITEELWDIQGECENVRWYFDTDDDTLINALDGNEDEAYEFKMMFADLCAECEQMRSDLSEEYLPECFNDLFVAAGGAEYGGGLLGWDSYEGDYFGLDCTDAFAEDESMKRLMRMQKKDLVGNVRQCLKILYQYIGLRNRYDSLKAALDILRDENTGYLQMVNRIEELYKKAECESIGFKYFHFGGAMRELDSMLAALPKEAWVQ